MRPEDNMILPYSEVLKTVKQFFTVSRFDKEVVIKSRVEISPDGSFALVIDTWKNGKFSHDHRDFPTALLEQILNLRKSFELWQNT